MNLNQVTLPSLDVPKAIEFYKKLGLELIVHTHDNYARFVCPEGKSTFSIHKVESLPSGEIPTVYFEVEDVDKTYNALSQLGIPFLSKPADQPWLWREAHLVDLDNNKLVIYHAGVNRVCPPWAINK